MPKKGLLLINLGTPDAPTTPAVRRYLDEFLSDPRVIDISPIGRWLLLHLIILRVRPRKSAEAYRKVWMAEGSPLIVYSTRFLQSLARELGSEFEVELGMRYGNPSLELAVSRLRAKGVQRLVVLPLYPQYAAASTASSLAKVYEVLSRAWDVSAIQVVPAFFQHPGFLDAFAVVIQPVLKQARADHTLFSFHGLPERQIRRSDWTKQHCLASAGCCDQVGEANANCYRAQSYFTARSLAARLGLSSQQFTVSFQSRLGRTPWIKPYTDLLIADLASRGVKRLAVVCPSFVADCLETLEEIGIRGRESFLAAGGEELALVPCLNAHPTWIRAAAQMAREATA